jgi:protein-S-isoprenylcysteine O-methyltransferase Ste14
MWLLLKNVLFTVVVPGTVGVYAPLALAAGRPWAPAPLLAVAVVLLFAGAAIYAWCVWDFAAFGRGTPAPIDAPKKLVVRGLYRYTRNPMYVGVLTAILGWALAFQARNLVVYALVVFTGFHLFVLLYEEPHLQREFGDEYARYRARVNRWLPWMSREAAT